MSSPKEKIAQAESGLALKKKNVIPCENDQNILDHPEISQAEATFSYYYYDNKVSTIHFHSV